VNEYTQRRAFMRRAVELGKKSISEDVKKPVVGVVIVRDGEVLGESFRGETGEGRHAEFGLLDRLKSGDIVKTCG
jgi:pyrimidine deaminase RibD-like protein